MPDLPVAEGGRPGSGGKGLNWVMIGGVAGVGALVLMIMSSKGGGSSGTTAAGTSINAALGSIQEQNLNIMGLIGQSEQRLTDELGNVNDNIIAGNGAIQGQITGNTYMSYYQSAYYYAQQMAANALGHNDTAGYQAWLGYANQFSQAIEDGRVAGYGSHPNYTTDIGGSTMHALAA